MAHVTPTLHVFDLSGNVVTHKPTGIVVSTDN